MLEDKGIKNQNQLNLHFTILTCNIYVYSYTNDVHVVFTGQVHFILSHVIKIPASLLRLAGLGPSADTTANWKNQVVRLLTPQQSTGIWSNSLESLKNNFIICRKKSEPVDSQHKNKYNWLLNPSCTFSLLYIFTVYVIATEQKEEEERYMYMQNQRCRYGWKPRISPRY